MSVKSDMMRTFTVGSRWVRVHHQTDSHVGQEIVEKGQPVKLKVIAQQRNDGIVFELPSGHHSWLSWPQSTWIDATFTPNLVTLSNKYGTLLTYTRDTGVAEALAAVILDNEIDRHP